MAVQRKTPHIWATWLPKMLTGENACKWAVWFKAHNRSWTRRPSDFNQAQWLLDHTALLNKQRAQWEARGHDVYVEGDRKEQPSIGHQAVVVKGDLGPVGVVAR